MFKSLYTKLRTRLHNWLIYEPPQKGVLPFDFSRLKYELKPGDVLLFEGRSRIAGVIRYVTQSPWTHAALYIGRIHDHEDEEMQNLIRAHTDSKESTRLIVEDLIDQGTILTHLTAYKNHHIRICRPIGISPGDLHLVLKYALRSLGQPYNVRHLFDLARFLLPWGILPRRWGSSLFRTSSGEPESGICSSLIAEAFSSVQFPILPYIEPDEVTGIQVYQRNPYLFSPKDFDYSPYFEIIKYPLFNPNEPLPYYRRIPWNKTGRLHHDHGVLGEPKKVKQLHEDMRDDKDIPPGSD